MTLPRLAFGLLAAGGVLCLSGCIGLGVAVLGSDENTLQHPQISIDKGVVLQTEDAAPWFDAGELKRHWGAPDGVERVSETVERWQYNFGLRWNGVGVLIAFLPIPIMVPVGHEYVEFTIERGWVASARTMEHTWIAMAGCGASAIPHASGSECVLDGRPERKSRIVLTGLSSTPGEARRVKIINARERAVSVVHKDDRRYGTETRFVLEPRQSRIVLTRGYGTISAKDDAGRPIIAKGERFVYRNQKDGTVVYLIADGYIVPVPPKSWGDWEAHVRELVDAKYQGPPEWAEPENPP
jgi:hypothetical protein